MKRKLFVQLCCIRDEGMAPRSLVAGLGFKPPRAAVVKSHGGERRWKRHLSGVRYDSRR